jgi:quinohemoprotein ethanol dehydrogenase
MVFADLTIDDKLRKVLMIAPKNGFFYLIDRTNGRLISAKPFARTTWASGIDLATGRPVENPRARFPDGETFTIWPGSVGAHSWMPMAYSPGTHLVYLPTIEMAVSFNDKGVNLETWKRPPNNLIGFGLNLNIALQDAGRQNGTSRLQAWDPVAQKAVWQVSTPGPVNGGVAATAGGLIFQGQLDGKFNAYSATDGRLLWSFDAQAPVIAPPVVYSVRGQEYVTVLAGLGTGSASLGKMLPPNMPNIDYRTQARRVLTFTIDGTVKLPAATRSVVGPANDPAFTPNAASAARGEQLFGQACTFCHGINLVAGGGAPDLRASSIPLDRETFRAVVHAGALVPNGMPKFDEFSDAQLNDLRQYIRTQAQAMH